MLRGDPAQAETISQSPGGQLQAGTILHGPRSPRMGREYHLHNLDDLCLGYLLPPDFFTCDKGKHELRIGEVTSGAPIY